MESMTGFARQSVNKKNLSINIQAKSLNARFLELKVGLPSDLAYLEEDIRKKVKTLFDRGTIDLGVYFRKDSSDLPIATLKKWVKDYQKNAKILGVQDDLTMGKVLKRASGELKESLSVEDKKMIMSSVDKALLVLKKRREVEGKALKAVLLKEIKNVRAELLKVKDFVKKHKKVLVGEWNEKLSKIKNEQGFEADTKRLEAEVAILLEKGDIAEEIDRIDIHLKEFVKIMSEKKPLIGKKLDFFCQELAREANTIASKSKNAELTRLSVNLKSYVEKLRQQVQNIQ